MAETIVSLALEKLSGLLIQEAAFVLGVGDDEVERRVGHEVERLRAELQRMESFLKDAEEHKQHQHQKQLDRTVVAQIRDLAFEAEDVIDSFASQVALNYQRGGFRGVLKRCTSRFTMPSRLHKVEGQVKQIQTKLEDIFKTLPAYNAIPTGRGEGSSSNISQQQQRQLRRIRTHVEEDDDVVSLEGITKDVLARLMTKEDRLHVVVSIVGMGGIGKTTLAKKAFHRIENERYFDCVAWAFISQQCTPRDVFYDVLTKVASPSSKEEKEEIAKLKEDELSKRLYDALEEKLYLVVLDDIWQSNDWESLKHAFPRGKLGSKIMLTTRNKDLALRADPFNSPIDLPLLTDDESWKLFSRKAAFPINLKTDESLACLEQFENLGRKMVRKCGGLPLAIVVLGGLLATKRTLHQWEMVDKDVRAHINESHCQDNRYGKVNQILGLSYDDLPFCLKQCFLYLSHYLEDWAFSKIEVIRLWIAEGFIPCPSERGGMTLEDVAELYLEELINRCLVQVDKRDYTGEGVRTCRLHDLLRDMCLQKAEEERFMKCFRLEAKENNNDYHISAATTSSPNKVTRRIAINLRETDVVGKRYINMSVLPVERDFENTRSLLLCSGAHTWVKFDIPKGGNNNFRLLRVLKLFDLNYDFERGKIWGVPSEIGKLVHLRYLGLGYPRVELPHSIGNLKNLYTLRIRSVRAIRIPDVLYKLEKLRHLLVGSTRRSTNIHSLKFLSGANNIVELRLMGCELKHDPMDVLGQLPGLRIVELRHGYMGRKMVCSANRFPQLQEMVISYFFILEEWEIAQSTMPRLKRLRLEGLGGMWRLPEGLQHITTLQQLELCRMKASLVEGLEEMRNGVEGEDRYKVRHIPSIHLIPDWYGEYEYFNVEA